MSQKNKNATAAATSALQEPQQQQQKQKKPDSSNQQRKHGNTSEHRTSTSQKDVDYQSSMQRILQNSRLGVSMEGMAARAPSQSTPRETSFSASAIRDNSQNQHQQQQQQQSNFAETQQNVTVLLHPLREVREDRDDDSAGYSKSSSQQQLSEESEEASKNGEKDGGFKGSPREQQQQQQRLGQGVIAMREFNPNKLDASLNYLLYGIEANLCVPSRKSNQRVTLAISPTHLHRLLIFYFSLNKETSINISFVLDVKYKITNPNHLRIRGVDEQRALVFVYREKEDEIEGILQFDTPQLREHFAQGFQHFYQLALSTQLISCNPWKVYKQIQKQSENVLQQSHDGHPKAQEQEQLLIRDVMEVLEEKARLNISKSWIKSEYVKILKQKYDIQLTAQQISYEQYREKMQHVLQSPVSNSHILDMLSSAFACSDLEVIFDRFVEPNPLLKEQKKAADHNNNNDTTSRAAAAGTATTGATTTTTMSIENLQQFLLYYQNQQLTKQQTQRLLSHSLGQPKQNTLTFIEFTQFIFSPQNSIFDPNRLPLYQDMNRPISEYYVNSAKNIFHSNFDMTSINRITGYTLQSSHQVEFALLYALSRGARYIEIEVWDGESGEPVVIYGPTMNSKYSVNDFARQLVQQAFVVNPYPIFLNIVSHCSIKQSFKLKYCLEKQLHSHLYELPVNYKEMTKLPSPNDLKYRIIHIGKLPHTYDGLIQESYTYQDVIRIQQEQIQQDQKETQTKQQPHSHHTQQQQHQESNQQQNLEVQQQQQQPNAAAAAGMSNNNLNSSLGTNNNPHNNNMNTNPNQTDQMNSQRQYLKTQNLDQTYHLQLTERVDGSLLTPVHRLSIHDIPLDDFIIDKELAEILSDQENEQEIQDRNSESAQVLQLAARNAQGIPAAAAVPEDQIIESGLQQQQQQQQQNEQRILNEGEEDGDASGVLPGSTARGNLNHAQQIPKSQLVMSSPSRAINKFFSQNMQSAAAPKLKKYIQNNANNNIEGVEKESSEMSCEIIESFATLTLPSQIRNVYIPTIPLAARHSQYQEKYSPEETQGDLLLLTEENEPQPIAQTHTTQTLIKQTSIANNNHNNNNQNQQQLNLALPNENLAIGRRSSSQNSGEKSRRIPLMQPIQLHCVRDYGPMLASNAIEGLFAFCVSKIQKRQPSLWEIYEFSERDLTNLNLGPLTSTKNSTLSNSVVSTFSSVSTFTKYHLALAKPRCKAADAKNMNPAPLFNQGIQFVMNFMHCFDRNSLVYHAQFHQNGGPACGYVLKPFHLRNHSISVGNNTLETFGEDSDEHFYINNLRSPRYKVHLRIISAFNLPVSNEVSSSSSKEDHISPYVEVIVIDGQHATSMNVMPTNMSFRTNVVENNNLNPQWNHDIKFTLHNPSNSYLVFQCINAATNSARNQSTFLAWYAIPFNCIRQGIRIVPLCDGFFNTIKNSFLLCQTQIIKEPSGI